MSGFTASVRTAGIPLALGCLIVGIVALALPDAAAAQVVGGTGVIPGQTPPNPNGPSPQIPGLPGTAVGQSPDPQATDRDDYTQDLDPIQDQARRPPVSFAARSLGKEPNATYGFSAGLSRSYLADLDSPSAHAINLTSLQTGLFGQVRKKRSLMNFDYGLGLNRRESTSARPSDVSNRLGFSLIHQMSRRMSLQFQDSFSSAINDFPGMLTLGSGAFAVENFTQFVDVPLQRVTSNLAALSLGYQHSRRAHLALTAAYDYRHYGLFQVAQNNSLQIGILGELQLNRWLSLENSYSAHIGRATQQSGASSIQRIRLGGLKTRTPNGIEASFENGIEVALDRSHRRVHWSAQSSLSKTSRLSTVALTYHRGLSSTVETSHILTVDTVGLSLNQWLLSRRVNFRTGSQYMRGSTEDRSPVKTGSVSAALSVALQSHVLLSANYTYVSQHLGAAAVGGPQRRYNAGVSLDYYLRSLVSRR